MSLSNHLQRIEEFILLSQAENDSFAFKTMSSRIPALIHDVIEHNKEILTDEQQKELLELYNDMINDHKVRKLPNIGDGSEEWINNWESWKDKTWLKAPWFYSEAYFFRLILHITGFFEHGKDPFHYTKMKELENESTWNLLETTIQHITSHNKELNLINMMKHCLWGNKADGCYKEVKDSVTGEEATLLIDDKFLLVNHIEMVLQHLQQFPKMEIQFINDNCGVELLMDLTLVDLLLHQEWCTKITFHLKKLPTYVSDARIVDVKETIESMMQPNRNEIIKALGQRLKKYIIEEKLVLKDHIFWSSCRFYYEFPSDIKEMLQNQTSLVFIKGDANYRRLLGDRRWPETISVNEAIPFFPTSFVSLRTLKSDPIVGIHLDTVEKLNQQDTLWKVNGKYGIIQSVLQSN